MPPLTNSPPSEAEESIILALTRMEAKMDVALAQHGAMIDKHRDMLDDHELRLRAQESRKTVSPSALWAAVASIIAAFGVMAPYLIPLLAA